MDLQVKLVDDGQVAETDPPVDPYAVLSAHLAVGEPVGVPRAVAQHGGDGGVVPGDDRGLDHLPRVLGPTRRQGRGGTTGSSVLIQ